MAISFEYAPSLPVGLRGFFRCPICGQEHLKPCSHHPEYCIYVFGSSEAAQAERLANCFPGLEVATLSGVLTSTRAQMAIAEYKKQCLLLQTQAIVDCNRRWQMALRREINVCEREFGHLSLAYA